MAPLFSVAGACGVEASALLPRVLINPGWRVGNIASVVTLVNWKVYNTFLSCLVENAFDARSNLTGEIRRSRANVRAGADDQRSGAWYGASRCGPVATLQGMVAISTGEIRSVIMDTRER